MKNELMTVKEVAAALKVSVRQVWKLCSRGRFPSPVRLGRSVRWRAADLSRYIAAGCDMRRYQDLLEAERRAAGVRR